MLTEFECDVMHDINKWAEKFYMGEQNAFEITEIVEDYWHSYFNNCSMGDFTSSITVI